MVVPATSVVVSTLPSRIWMSESICGAILSIVLRKLAAICLASLSVRLLTGVVLGVALVVATVVRETAVPMRRRLRSDVTLSRLVPIELTASVTRCFAPSPMATTIMTTPTPMMMPSIVSAVRILLLASPRRATRKHSNRFIRLPSSRFPITPQQGYQKAGFTARRRWCRV